MSFIQCAREFVSEDVVESHDWFWKKVGLLEETSYRALRGLTDATERLNGILSDLLNKLVQVLLKGVRKKTSPIKM